jgi:hypothetical protein
MISPLMAQSDIKFTGTGAAETASTTAAPVTTAEVLTAAYRPSIVERIADSRGMRYIRLGTAMLMLGGVLAACGGEEDYTLECPPNTRYVSREVQKDGQTITQEACVETTRPDNDTSIIWFFHNGTTYVPSSRGNTYIGNPSSPEYSTAKPPVVRPSSGFGGTSGGGSGAS